MFVNWFIIKIRAANVKKVFNLNAFVGYCLNVDEKIYNISK